MKNKRRMKKITKRILAMICCVAMLLTSLSVANLWNETALAASQSTISITSTAVNYTKSNGFINLRYSGAASDYRRGIDFLTEEFIRENVTFGGGMKAEDLLDGKNIFYLATADVLQFNWSNRENAFAEGWSFTFAQGTKLPYTTTGDTTAYVTLDAEYTFSIGAGNSDCDNIFKVTQYSVTRYALDTENLIANGLEDGNGILIRFADNTISDFQVKYGQLETDMAYADYINFDGLKFDTLAGKGITFRYILDGSIKCIQMQTWGELRESVQKGDQLIFYKGMPIYYTGTDGKNYKSVLDATYVYECFGSNEFNHQIYKGVKYDADKNVYGFSTGEFTTAAQGNEIIRNLTFDSASKDKIKVDTYVSHDIVTDLLAADYLDIAGYSAAQAHNMGLALRFIPGANVLQLAFGEKAVETLKAGDQIILKKGMPVVYDSNSYAPDTATLDDGYTITIKENNGTNMTLICEKSGEYALSGEISGQKEEAGCYFYDVRFKGELFADAKDQFQGNFPAMEPLFQDYFEVSGKSASDLSSDGWMLRRYNLPGVYVGLRFYCPTGAFDLTSDDKVIFKKGFPISYTTTDGKAKTITLDKDYGFVFNGNGFAYDASISSSEEEDDTQQTVVNEYELDTLLVTTIAEGNEQVASVNITGAPFKVKQAVSQVLTTDANAEYFDYSGCASGETVKNNLTIRAVLTDADTQVLQVCLTENGVNALVTGDKIVLKQNLPFAYNEANADAVAKLDDTYVLRVTDVQDGQVTMQVELTGTYSLTEVFYHSEEYTNVKFAPGADLSDAIAIQNAPIDDACIQQYIGISEHSYEDLKAQGYTLGLYCIPELRAIRIWYDEFDLKAGDVMLFKEGLPISYTTTSGKYKTVYLDKTYGYKKNAQTAFVYDASITEIKETEIIPIGLANECGSYQEVDGSTRFNLYFADGELPVSSYVQADIMQDQNARQLVSVKGYTTEKLLEAGFRVVFIPSPGVFQICPGTLDLADISEITFGKGLSISYYDNGPKKAVLDEDYTYRVAAEGERYVMKRLCDYDIKITVDGIVKVQASYREGTKLDFEEYKNTAKGKVMSIQVNGEPIGETTYVVSEDADIVIQNRADLCVVIFQDGKETVAVREYLVDAKNIKLPYAPDWDGYDDSWESFQLVNGTITVKAVHTVRQTEPTVSLKDMAFGDTSESESDKEAGTSAESPKTGDFAKNGMWLLIMLGAAVVVVLCASRKRKQLM